jgi:hypothetical protein
MVICFLNCNFQSDQVIFGFLTLYFKTGFADNYNRCESMNDLTNLTGINSNPGSYTPTQIISAERSGVGYQKDMPQTSSKYILDVNSFFFSRSSLIMGLAYRKA